MTTDPEAAWNDFLEQAILAGRPIVNNCPQEAFAVPLGPFRAPVTVNRAGSAKTSWVDSLRNAYGPYARVELDLVKMAFGRRQLCRVASHLGEALLCAGGLSGGAFLGNWRISTNLHPAGLAAGHWLAAAREVTEREPALPVVIRSLTPALHADVLRDLEAEGFLLFPTRQIWIAENLQAKSWAKPQDVKRDLTLERRSLTSHQWIEGRDLDEAQLGEALRLFNDLYRIKYPVHNPEFTPDFLRLGISTGILKVIALRRRNESQLCGMIGMIRRGEVMATTALGYDLNSSPDEGLYRLLSIKAFLEAREAGLPLHCSAGAGGFKRNRGARHHIEFAAIWISHLPRWRQALLRQLHALLRKVAVPLLEQPIL